MAVRFVLIISLLFCVAFSDLVRKKSCKNVDTRICSIHNVNVDPCPDGPAYCILRPNKPYGLTVDYTPRFNADNLKMSILSDENKADNFETEVVPPSDACVSDECGLEKNIRRNFNTSFMFDKKSHGKFPVQVKLWNTKNETESCCFTFKVRMLKHQPKY